MLSLLLGFGGRLGRLHYFLLTIVLAIVLTILTISMVVRIAPQLAAADGRLPAEPTGGMMLAIVLVVMPPFLWFTLALQAKRFRDMGWRPLPVMLAWGAADLLDIVMGSLIPALGRDGQGGTQGGTLAGTLLNLAMVGCLLFWPSAPEDPEQAAPLVSDPRRRSRPAAPAHAMPPPPQGFGRRRSF